MRILILMFILTLVSPSAYAGSLEVVSHYLRRMAEAEEKQAEIMEQIKENMQERHSVEVSCNDKVLDWQNGIQVYDGNGLVTLDTKKD